MTMLGSMSGATTLLPGFISLVMQKILSTETKTKLTELLLEVQIAILSLNQHLL